MDAYFAGGCFWCITPIFKELNGVKNVRAGYAGGDVINPTYEDVKKQITGHRETIHIIYDESIISYDRLVEVFISVIDPYDNNGQFIDVGFSYTLAIFYLNEYEKNIADKMIKELEDKSNKKVYISLLPFKNYFDAEEYHQDYYLKNKEAFEEELIKSKRKSR